MEHLIKPLKDLGLSEKEAGIYLALLQLGPSTPYQIAKKAGLKRPTAYVLAEELVAKGLIVHMPGEDKKRYIARTPDTFIEAQEERLAAAKKILPELRSFQKGVNEKPSIMYFEGIEGLKQAYDYKKKELHGKEIVGFFSSGLDSSPEMTQIFMEWNEYKERHHTKVRGVTVDTPNLKPFEKFINQNHHSIDAKFLPQNIYSAEVSIESCDGKFVRICFMESVETLIIESPKFAKAIKEILEIVWRGLGDKYEEPATWK